jgi:glucosamine 6-phosphate synthetase-like amidotransferase/phosphosugar isomerase protein
MCGIVGYFGSSNTGISSILTGMSAIIYRAPDSTGIGWFGDEKEPIALQRTVGSVSALIGKLAHEKKSFPFRDLYSSLLPASTPEFDYEALQEDLLQWEGFAPEDVTRCEADVDVHSIEIMPGIIGSPPVAYTFTVQSVDELEKCFQQCAEELDLSTTVTKTILTAALREKRGLDAGAHATEIPREEIIGEFEAVCDRIAEGRAHSIKDASVDTPERRALWNVLEEITFTIPGVFSCDGVRSLFHIIDGALLAQIPFIPALREEVQQVFTDLWPSFSPRDVPDWLTFYTAEKEMNLVGVAAAAAWDYLKARKNVYDDAALVSLLSTPVLAHGRWAMQSPVTEENAHPFFDERKERIIALNGQFNARIEQELKRFLQLTGFSFRSENSSEFVSLLWGYYFDVFAYEKKRGETIQLQVDAGLETYATGSQNIDYRIYTQLRGKNDTDLDELAFIEAARNIVGMGGQIAVAGISLHSPQRMYVASHNRPVFLAHTAGSKEVMVVSDINAALGLFPQKLIYRKQQEIGKLFEDYTQELSTLKQQKASQKQIRDCRARFQKAKASLIECFTITVVPLEGEEKIATIENHFERGSGEKKITVRRFDGEKIDDIEEFEMTLDPSLEELQPYTSFYETHLMEIPDRLHDMLSIYVPEGISIPQLQLRKRTFFRRFGYQCNGLKRIVLVGMGTSYNIALMAKHLFYSMVPRVEIVTLKPIDIINAKTVIDPERDIVLLLSWSGTTADMVECAKDLSRHNVTMVAATNKPYADLGLITMKSGGRIHVYSGEELTFTAVKSPVSMLYALGLFGLWYLHVIGKERSADKIAQKLHAIPEHIGNVLEAYREEDFSRFFPEKPSFYTQAYIIDSLSLSGTGYEVAWKLSENSGQTVARVLDYREVDSIIDECDPAHTLVFVHATHKGCLQEALTSMKLLYLAEIPFIVVSYDHRFLEAMQYYSANRVITVPKTGDAMQPLVDLVLYYFIVYRFALAQGHIIPGFPRNRAKSVTISRKRSIHYTSRAAELQALQNYADTLASLFSSRPEEKSHWEKEAVHGWEQDIYGAVQKLARTLTEETLLDHVFSNYQADIRSIAATVHNNFEEDGELVLVPLDRQAQAGSHSFLSICGYFMKGGVIRVEPDLRCLHTIWEDTIVILLASKPPPRSITARIPVKLAERALWIGPDPQEFLTRNQVDFPARAHFLGSFFLRNDFSCIPHLNIFVCLTVLWNEIKKDTSTQKVLSLVYPFLNTTILSSQELRQGIDRCMEQCNNYKTALFITPFYGAGMEWEERFDRTDTLFVSSHRFGESGHGPLATVDPDIQRKCIKIQDHSAMVEAYGEEQVRLWEETYCNGKPFDVTDSSMLQESHKKSPGLLYSQGYWFLPVIRPDYDTGGDSLVLVDAVSNRYSDQVMDELSTFGCRYAHMLIITQEIYRDPDERNRGPFDYSTGEVIFLPCLRSENGEIKEIADIFLPFVHTLLSTAFAARGSTTGEILYDHTVKEHEVLTHTFGLLGETLYNLGVDITHLNTHLIAAFKSLAPLITEIVGSAQYSVKKIHAHEQVELLPDTVLAADKETLLEHFAILKSQGEPFFLLKPEFSSFQGEALTATKDIFEEKWHEWFEAFSDTWESLATGSPGIIESRIGVPLLEFPLLDSHQNGRLYQLYVRYREWDYSRPLPPQIAQTLEAMQKGVTSINQKSPGYITLVSCFNEIFISYSLDWDDWLIALVPRSWLMGKRSSELAEIIAERTAELLRLSFGKISDEHMEQLEKKFESQWANIGNIGRGEEPDRWETILSLLT